MAQKFTAKDLDKLQAEGKILSWKFIDGRDEKAVKRSKYGNQRTELDGFTFDSIKESKRYMELRMMRAEGLITDLELQKEYRLEVNGEKVASYYADFCYMTKEGEIVVEDVKSKMTRRLPVYRLKKRLMKSIHQIEIKEV